MTRQWIIDHQSLDMLSIIREKIDKNNQVAKNTIFLTQTSDDRPQKSSASSFIKTPPRWPSQLGPLACGTSRLGSEGIVQASKHDLQLQYPFGY
ncbi:hypothetical protein F4809DRAFT_614450 [Biscogniauxia mediterranea]|nr:hypothetical protein F4809DRAFT_614450 [Biscogniauxia mediterranea]